MSNNNAATSEPSIDELIAGVLKYPAVLLMALHRDPQLLGRALDLNPSPALKEKIIATLQPSRGRGRPAHPEGLRALVKFTSQGLQRINLRGAGREQKVALHCKVVADTLSKLPICASLTADAVKEILYPRKPRERSARR